jgi:hypothetical protein
MRVVALKRLSGYLQPCSPLTNIGRVNTCVCPVKRACALSSGIEVLSLILHLPE